MPFVQSPRRARLAPVRPRLALLLAGLALFARAPAAAENPFVPEATMSAFTGLEEGGAKELVFEGGSRLSELDWGLAPLWSAGVGAELAWNIGLRLESETSVGLPGPVGIMEDSDYMNVNLNGSAARTHYSRHEATVEYSYSLAARLGWDFRLGEAGGERRTVTVTPFVGFRYGQTKWAGSNGYLQHPDVPGYPTVPGAGGIDTYQEWSESTPKVYVTGTGIDYLGETWAPTVGVRVRAPAGDRLLLEFAFEGSPLVWWNGIDRHFYQSGTNTYVGSASWVKYYDKLSGGYLLMPSFGAGFAVCPGVSLFASAQWRLVAGLRGDTYRMNESGSVTGVFRESYGDGGGAALSTLTIRFGCRANLGPGKP